jgi:AAHS family benzoate transporter-like MFS transporter
VGSQPLTARTLGRDAVDNSSGLPTAAVLYAAVALGGVGAMGTHTFVLAYASKYLPVRMGATALGWALGFGRLGSMLAPPLLGLIIGADWRTSGTSTPSRYPASSAPH